MTILKSEYKREFDGRRKTTNFYAKLSFKNQTQPLEKEKIRKRLSYDKKDPYEEQYYDGESNFITYFVDKGFSWENKPLGGGSPYLYSPKGFRLNFKTSKKKLSLDVIAKGSGKIEEEEIVNLKELNEFLLTGEYDYEKDWGNSFFRKR